MAKVFISSTGRDLAEYRAAAIEVCNRLSLIPIGMEFFGAMASGATEGSRQKLDEADVYVGMFAHRYGYIEEGYDASVTELEYDHAQKRNLKRFCFILDPEFKWPQEYYDRDNEAKLKALKERVEQEQIRASFTTVDNYKYKLMQALSGWLQKLDLGPQPPLRLQTFKVSKSTRFHFRAQRVPFLGFETELDRLEQFLKSPDNFVWWLVVAEAGAGKSRLALEVCQRRKDSWRVGFLPNNNGFMHWMQWQPAKPTLIIADYVRSRPEELQAIITALETHSAELAHPVRLLLLERRLTGDWWDTFR